MNVNGVTVKLSGDQAKLMENVSQVWTGSKQGKFNGKAKPQEDALKGGTDFATIIPSGFLLLHQDLQQMITGKSQQKSGLMSIADAVGPILVAVGAVAIAGAIVKGLFSGGGEKGENAIKTAIDELNSRITADQLAADPDVVAAQRQGIAVYVKTYFLAQCADLAVTTAIGAVGSGAAEAVTNLINSLQGKETKDEAQQHLKDIIDSIIMAQDPAAWQPGGEFWDDGLQKEVKIGIKAYLGVWFASQAASMAVETVAKGVGSAIGGAVNSLFTSLFGKETKDESKESLATIINAIITAQSPEEWAVEATTKGSDLNIEVGKGIRAYLGIWFATQAYSMAAETVAEGIGSAIGGAVNSLFTSLFGKKEKDESVVHLQDIITAIILAQDPAAWAAQSQEEGALKTEIQIGIQAYLGIWFAAQAVSMTAETVAEGAGSAISGAITGLFGSLFGKETKDEATVALHNIITAILTAQSPEEWAEKARTEGTFLHGEVMTGVALYLGLWFAAQSISMTAKTVAEGAGSAVGGAVNKLFTSLFGKETKDEATQALSDIITAILTAQTTDEWQEQARKEDTVLHKEVQAGVAAYLGMWFAAQAVSMTAQTVAEGAGSAVGGAVNKLFKSLFGKDTKDEATTALSDIITAILTAQNPEDWKKEASTKGTFLHGEVAAGIATYLGFWFAAQAVSMTAQTVAEGAGTSIGNFANKLFKGLFGKSEEKDQDSLQTKLSLIIDAVTEAIDVNEFINSDNLREAAYAGLGKYIEVYFETFSSGFDANQFKDSNKELAKSSTLTTTLLNKLNDTIKLIDPKDLADTVKSAEKEAVGKIAKDIFEAENAKIKKWYESSLTSKQVTTALGGISDAYLAVVKKSIENGLKIESSSTVTSKADNRVIDLLNNIQQLLTAINQDTGAIKEKPVMVPPAPSADEELEVYSTQTGSENR